MNQPIPRSGVDRLRESVRANRPRSSPGMLTSYGPGGSLITTNPISRKSAGGSSETQPFEIFGPYLDGSDWKIGVEPGTVDGTTPVVGAVTGSGGSTLDSTSRITLATGENMVVVGIKTDLETREVLRLTIEVLEDSELTPVVDTGARTRIAYIPIAELNEASGPIWTLASQTVTTHLRYFTAGSADIIWRA